MPSRNSHRLLIVLAGAIVGLVLELIITGGSLEADPERLAVYYATTFPWGNIGTVILLLLLSLGIETSPALIDPFVFCTAGFIQGAVLALLGLWLRQMVRRRDRSRDEPSGRHMRRVTGTGDLEFDMPKRRSRHDWTLILTMVVAVLPLFVAVFAEELNGLLRFSLAMLASSIIGLGAAESAK
jgi:hypothetical protein